MTPAMIDNRTPRNFRHRNRDIAALPVMLESRLARDRAAWRFDLTLPGARRKTQITVSGYIAPDPKATLKEAIDMLLEPPSEAPPE